MTDKSRVERQNRTHLERFSRGDLGVLGVVNAPPVMMRGVSGPKTPPLREGAEGDVISVGMDGERAGETGRDHALAR